MSEQGQKFMARYYEYQSWKQRREELFPELSEPKKQLQKESWHLEGCPETDKIIIEPLQRFGPYASSDGYGWTEVWTCFDCRGEKQV